MYFDAAVAGSVELLAAVAVFQVVAVAQAVVAAAAVVVANGGTTLSPTHSQTSPKIML